MYQDKEIQNYLNQINPEYEVEDNMLLSIMDKVEKSKKSYRRKKHFFQLVTPFAVVVIIAITTIFPVFGSEKGSLVDVYNSYKVNRSIDDLDESTEMMKQDQNVKSFMYSSLLEKEYEIDPVELLELKYTHNIPSREAIILLLISKRTNVPIEELISMRKRRMNWGLIAKKSKISSKMVVSSIESLQKKYIETPKDGFVINGQVTNVNRSINCFFVERFPYPIFFSSNNEVIEALGIETPVSVEVKYDYEQSRYFATIIHVRPLSPNRPALFYGYVISIQNDTLVLGLRNGRRLVLKTPVHFSKMIKDDEYIEIGSRMKIASFVNQNGVNCMIDYWIAPNHEIEKGVSADRNNETRKVVTPSSVQQNTQKSIQQSQGKPPVIQQGGVKSGVNNGVKKNLNQRPKDSSKDSSTRRKP